MFTSLAKAATIATAGFTTAATATAANATLATFIAAITAFRPKDLESSSDETSAKMLRLILDVMWVNRDVSG